MVNKVSSDIVRAWFLTYIEHPDLEKIVQNVWFAIDQDYVKDKKTFIVRADIVEGLEGYNVVAPASAPTWPELEELRVDFRTRLREESGTEEVEVAAAKVTAHTPNPPHNNSPGYIGEDEQMSAVGPLRHSPWG